MKSNLFIYILIIRYFWCYNIYDKMFFWNLINVKLFLIKLNLSLKMKSYEKVL